MAHTDTLPLRVDLHTNSQTSTQHHQDKNGGNEAIHKRQNSHFVKEKNEELDRKIDDIFQELPNPRLVLPPCDAAFFKAERIKKYRLSKKESWVEEAMIIKDGFFASLDPQSENFLDRFVDNST